MYLSDARRAQCAAVAAVLVEKLTPLSANAALEFICISNKRSKFFFLHLSFDLVRDEGAAKNGCHEGGLGA